jgi:hypothetical protein
MTLPGHRWALAFFFLGSGIGACDGTEPSTEERGAAALAEPAAAVDDGAALECRWQDDTASLPAAGARAAVGL